MPVVGCNAGGIPSIIDHKDTGYLFEAGNTDQMAGYVSQLITEPSHLHAMSERARAEAERWGWEAATTNLREEHYMQAVRNHRYASGFQVLSAQPSAVSALAVHGPHATSPHATSPHAQGAATRRAHAPAEADALPLGDGQGLICGFLCLFWRQEGRGGV